MADAEVLERLRRMIDEPEDTKYTDDMLEGYLLEAADNLNLAAALVWDEKASAAATLVDTAESGSSRKMSQVADNAAKRATYYRGLAGGTESAPAATASATTTRAIRRA